MISVVQICVVEFIKFRSVIFIKFLSLKILGESHSRNGYKIMNIFLVISLNIVLGVQKNSLIETVPLRMVLKRTVSSRGYL